MHLIRTIYQVVDSRDGFFQTAGRGQRVQNGDNKS